MARRQASSTKRSSKALETSDVTAQEDRAPNTVATQAAEYVGTSLGRLLNQRDRLAKQVADLDRRIAAARGRVASTIAGRLPSLPALPAIPVLRRPKATVANKATERTGNRKKHRGKPESTAVPEEALRKMSAAATARAATRKRAAARSSR